MADALGEIERPLLDVCLGMQHLVESSDEGGEDIPCLGLVPGRTRRIRTSEPLPHIGWNRLAPTGEETLFRGVPDGGVYCYFLHGHRVRCDDRFVRARTEYGEPFPAAIRRGRVAGLQFHPEKSGPVGLRMLANFCRPNEEGP
jgi:glutamine amidotransferase